MQPPKFAVGDTVRIREWDDMAKEYGVRSNGHILPVDNSCYFVAQMSGLCGRTVKITRIDRYRCSNGNKTYQYFFAESVSGWNIVEYMLEPLELEGPPIDASGLIAAMCDMFE